MQFDKRPIFFDEDGIRKIRFGLKIFNAGRTSAYINRIVIDGGTSPYYTFFIDPNKDEIPVFSEKMNAVDGVIWGYVEYSMPLELGLRRLFRIEIKLGERPSQCTAILRPAGLLRKDGERYENPFQKHDSVPSGTEE